MNQNNWYIKLSYKETDILIPQSDIAESNFQEQPTNEKKMQTVSLDDFVTHCNIALHNKKSSCVLLTKTKKPFLITTSAVPQIQMIDSDSIKPIHGIFEKQFKSKGIVGFRFDTTTLQYAIDIQYLVKKGAKA